jgi:hypothetical protein
MFLSNRILGSIMAKTIAELFKKYKEAGGQVNGKVMDEAREFLGKTDHTKIGESVRLFMRGNPEENPAEMLRQIKRNLATDKSKEGLVFRSRIELLLAPLNKSFEQESLAKTRKANDEFLRTTIESLAEEIRLEQMEIEEAPKGRKESDLDVDVERTESKIEATPKSTKGSNDLDVDVELADITNLLEEQDKGLGRSEKQAQKKVEKEKAKWDKIGGNLDQTTGEVVFKNPFFAIQEEEEDDEDDEILRNLEAEAKGLDEFEWHTPGEETKGINEFERQTPEEVANLFPEWTEPKELEEIAADQIFTTIEEQTNKILALIKNASGDGVFNLHRKITPEEFVEITEKLGNAFHSLEILKQKDLKRAQGIIVEIDGFWHKESKIGNPARRIDETDPSKDIPYTNGHAFLSMMETLAQQMIGAISDDPLSVTRLSYPAYPEKLRQGILGRDKTSNSRYTEPEYIEYISKAVQPSVQIEHLEKIAPFFKKASDDIKMAQRSDIEGKAEYTKAKGKPNFSPDVNKVVQDSEEEIKKEREARGVPTAADLAEKQRKHVQAEINATPVFNTKIKVAAKLLDELAEKERALFNQLSDKDDRSSAKSEIRQRIIDYLAAYRAAKKFFQANEGEFQPAADYFSDTNFIGTRDIPLIIEGLDEKPFYSTKRSNLLQIAQKLQEKFDGKAVKKELGIKQTEELTHGELEKFLSGIGKNIKVEKVLVKDESDRSVDPQKITKEESDALFDKHLEKAVERQIEDLTASPTAINQQGLADPKWFPEMPPKARTDAESSNSRASGAADPTSPRAEPVVQQRTPEKSSAEDVTRKEEQKGIRGFFKNLLKGNKPAAAKTVSESDIKNNLAKQLIAKLEISFKKWTAVNNKLKLTDDTQSDLRAYVTSFAVYLAHYQLAEQFFANRKSYDQIFNPDMTNAVRKGFVHCLLLLGTEKNREAFLGAINREYQGLRNEIIHPPVSANWFSSKIKLFADSIPQNIIREISFAKPNDTQLPQMVALLTGYIVNESTEMDDLIATLEEHRASGFTNQARLNALAGQLGVEALGAKPSKNELIVFLTALGTKLADEKRFTQMIVNQFNNLSETQISQEIAKAKSGHETEADAELAAIPAPAPSQTNTASAEATPGAIPASGAAIKKDSEARVAEPNTSSLEALSQARAISSYLHGTLNEEDKEDHSLHLNYVTNLFRDHGIKIETPKVTNKGELWDAMLEAGQHILASVDPSDSSKESYVKNFQQLAAKKQEIRAQATASKADSRKAKVEDKVLQIEAKLTSLTNKHRAPLEEEEFEQLGQGLGKRLQGLIAAKPDSTGQVQFKPVLQGDDFIKRLAEIAALYDIASRFSTRDESFEEGMAQFADDQNRWLTAYIKEHGVSVTDTSDNPYEVISKAIKTFADKHPSQAVFIAQYNAVIKAYKQSTLEDFLGYLATNREFPQDNDLGVEQAAIDELDDSSSIESGFYGTARGKARWKGKGKAHETEAGQQQDIRSRGRADSSTSLDEDLFEEEDGLDLPEVVREPQNRTTATVGDDMYFRARAQEFEEKLKQRDAAIIAALRGSDIERIKACVVDYLADFNGAKKLYDFYGKEMPYGMEIRHLANQIAQRFHYTFPRGIDEINYDNLQDRLQEAIVNGSLNPSAPSSRTPDLEFHGTARRELEDRDNYRPPMARDDLEDIARKLYNDLCEYREELLAELDAGAPNQRIIEKLSTYSAQYQITKDFYANYNFEGREFDPANIRYIEDRLAERWDLNLDADRLRIGNASNMVAGLDAIVTRAHETGRLNDVVRPSIAERSFRERSYAEYRRLFRFHNVADYLDPRTLASTSRATVPATTTVITPPPILGLMRAHRPEDSIPLNIETAFKKHIRQFAALAFTEQDLWIQINLMLKNVPEAKRRVLINEITNRINTERAGRPTVVVSVGSIPGIARKGAHAQDHVESLIRELIWINQVRQQELEVVRGELAAAGTYNYAAMIYYAKNNYNGLIMETPAPVGSLLTDPAEIEAKVLEDLGERVMAAPAAPNSMERTVIQKKRSADSAAAALGDLLEAKTRVNFTADKETVDAAIQAEFKHPNNIRLLQRAYNQGHIDDKSKISLFRKDKMTAAEERGADLLYIVNENVIDDAQKEVTAACTPGQKAVVAADFSFDTHNKKKATVVKGCNILPRLLMDRNGNSAIGHELHNELHSSAREEELGARVHAKINSCLMHSGKSLFSKPGAYRFSFKIQTNPNGVDTYILLVNGKKLPEDDLRKIKFPPKTPGGPDNAFDWLHHKLKIAMYRELEKDPEYRVKDLSGVTREEVAGPGGTPTTRFMETDRDHSPGCIAVPEQDIKAYEEARSTPQASHHSFR